MGLHLPIPLKHPFLEVLVVRPFLEALVVRPLEGEGANPFPAEQVEHP